MNQKWFSRLYRLARLQRCYTKQPENQDFQNVMACTRSEIELVTSSNIMFHVTTKTDNGFFSPIYQHHDMASYLKQVTRDYFTFVCKDRRFAQSGLKMILKELEDPDVVNKFGRMGSIWFPDSLLSQFMRTGDPRVIGLKNFPADEASIEQLRIFVRKYASGAIHAYWQNSMARNGQWHTAAANRTMAVEALAGIMGLSYMITHAEYRMLVIDGEYRCFGLYTECAAGQDTTLISGACRRRLVSPQLQRELNRLNMLDVLTCEVDHCPENYFLIIRGDHAAGISVFDNSAEQNFPIRRNISFQTILKCAPYIREEGVLNRPYVDAQVADRLGQVSLVELVRGLRPYLRLQPVIYLYLRIRRVRKAIERSLETGAVCAVGYEEWNEQTLNKELGISQTKTYLHSYLQDCIHV